MASRCVAFARHEVDDSEYSIVLLLGLVSLLSEPLQVTSILSQFPIWKDYKDQKHDLFLVDRPAVGYLQGQCEHCSIVLNTQRTSRELCNIIQQAID